MPRLRHQVARPRSSSLSACFWKFVPAWHAQGLACHALLKASPSCWRPTPHHPSGTPEFIGSSSSSLENTTSVPCHETGVSHPSFTSSSCWHATPHFPSGTPEFTGPIILPLENITSVPRHEIGVSCPSIAMIPKVGVPHLDIQVACQSGMIELACHALDTKWHAQLYLASLAAGVPCLITQVAHHSGTS
ncbi:hypothetical protein AHAS_Ahas09G0132200 [Arachis hypogaea]